LAKKYYATDESKRKQRKQRNNMKQCKQKKQKFEELNLHRHEGGCLQKKSANAIFCVNNRRLCQGASPP